MISKSRINSFASELLPPVSTYDGHVRTASFDHRRSTTRPTITLAAPHLHARDHPRVHDITAALTPPPNVETAADPLQHAHPSSVGRLRTSCAARARPGLMMSHAMPTTAKAPRVRCQQRKPAAERASRRASVVVRMEPLEHVGILSASGHRTLRAPSMRLETEPNPKTSVGAVGGGSSGQSWRLGRLVAPVCRWGSSDQAHVSY